MLHIFDRLFFFPEELSTCATRCKRSMRRCFWRENRCWGQPADLWCRKPCDNRTISRQRWLFDSFPSKHGFLRQLWDLGTWVSMPCSFGKSWSLIIFWGQVPCFFFPFDSSTWKYILFHLVEAASSRRSVESPLSLHFSAWTPRRLTSD